MSSPKQQTGTAPAEEDARVLVGSTIAGRYRVESLLGQGGMGAVYLVQHIGIRKRMALKVLQQKMMSNPTVVARFEREAMAAAHIDHPNVAAASDFGRTEDGRFYLALEYVEGRELRDVIDESRQALPPVRALFIARQIASTLTRAHELGIVHRDLKPENIMLVARDGHDDFVKVLDFGLALVSRQISQEEVAESSAPTAHKITQVGEIFGTPAYMAPEQAIGAVMDIRTDLYSLGVVLYEMLTGLRPFASKSALVLIQHHLAVPPPPMKERVPAISVPSNVEALVQRLLEKTPADRFQTPQELIAAIDEVAAAHELAWPGSAAPALTTEGRASQSAPKLEKVPPPSSTREPLLGRTLATMRAHLGPALEKARSKVFAKQTTGDKLKKALTRLRQQLKKTLEKKLPRSLQRLPMWVVVSGAVLALALLLGALFYLIARAPPAAQPGEPAHSRPLSPQLLATQESLDAATAQGSVALETLASRFPSDARILRTLLRSYSGQHQNIEAMRTLARLGKLDPQAARDPELVRIIVTALQANPEASQAATTLLEQELGEAGIDLLYDLTTKPTQTRWKSRLSKSLARPEVLAKASPATRLALELRSAKTCEARRDLFPRAQREGDQRVLALLKSMLQTDGCGVFGTNDCWPCLRKLTVLQDTIAALEARISKP